MRAEILTATQIDAPQYRTPQFSGPSCTLEFSLGSAMAIDGLIEYFDNLRVNDKPVHIKFDQDCETPGAVRVSFPLPVESILKSIDLAAFKGSIVDPKPKKV